MGPVGGEDLVGQTRGPQGGGGGTGESKGGRLQDCMLWLCITVVQMGAEGELTARAKGCIWGCACGGLHRRVQWATYECAQGCIWGCA